MLQPEPKPNKRKWRGFLVYPQKQQRNKANKQTKYLRKLIIFPALPLSLISQMLPHCVWALNKTILCSSSEHYHMVSATALVPEHGVLRIPHWTGGMISHLGMSFSDFKALLRTISLTGGMAWINTITMNPVSWGPEGLVSQKLNFQQTTHCISNIHQAM